MKFEVEQTPNIYDRLSWMVTGPFGYLPHSAYKLNEAAAIRHSQEVRDALDLQTHLGLIEVMEMETQRDRRPPGVWWLWFIADAHEVRENNSNYLSSPESAIQAWKAFEQDPKWQKKAFDRECEVG